MRENVRKRGRKRENEMGRVEEYIAGAREEEKENVCKRARKEKGRRVREREEKEERGEKG